MTRERPIVRLATWPVIAASVGLLVGARVGSASDQGIFLDLTRALQNAAEMSTRRSFSPTDPEVLTQKATDFILLGVVIAGETRLALVQLTASAGPELLSVGGSLGGYRLTDVEANQVTLEGQRGERVILRLQTGGGAGGEIALSRPTGRVETPKPTDSSEFDRPESVRAKEDRSARRTERDAQQKVRDLAQRAASGQSGQSPSEPQR